MNCQSVGWPASNTANDACVRVKVEHVYLALGQAGDVEGRIDRFANGWAVVEMRPLPDCVGMLACDSVQHNA